MADKKATGAAGEHWVCSVLSGLGWAAALTRDGVERTDVLASHPDGKLVSIQVKTASSSSARFRAGSRSCLPSPPSAEEWFVLVRLAQKPWEAPCAYVVPRNHVAAGVWIEHQEWITNPSIEPGKRNTPLDRFSTSPSVFARYEQRWDLLALRTSEVPIMLPPRFRALVLGDRVSLRPDHPWSEALPPWDLTESAGSWNDWLRTQD